jgi:hypothetical protein
VVATACTVVTAVSHPSRHVERQLGVAVTTGVIGHAGSAGGSVTVCRMMQSGSMQPVTPGQNGATGVVVHVKQDDDFVDEGAHATESVTVRICLVVSLLMRL